MRPDQNREQVQLDLNNPVFQKHLFSLPKHDQVAVLGALRKLSAMTWQQIYAGPGLKWEAISSRSGPNGSRMYSFRISKKIRGLAYRDNSWLRILSLHADYDSAYE
ncbi:MAG TPA: hypothetical protein ENN39_12690 [Desulfonatronum sp.]|mgnify:CR=1 FL=1|nr:hypothetical protein [Desulfonatronum sp.]